MFFPRRPADRTTRQPARLKLSVNSLEERLMPSWGSTPPATVTAPTSNVAQVSLDTNGDATGNASVATTETDWYKFTATTGGTYVIDATTPSSNLDTVAAVYTSTGSRVGYNDDAASGTTDSKVTVTLTAGQSYFLGVTNYTGSAAGSYTWKIDGPATTVTPPTPTPTGTGAWTIFVYMTASNLQEFAATDVNEMEKAAASLPSNVHIVVLWDQSSTLTKYATGNGSQAAWGTTGRAVITPDTNMSKVATTFDIIGEKNTGDPNTLKDFLKWGAAAAPAQNYSLIMWNHGAGIYGSNFDDSDGGTMDNLMVSEVAGVLGSAGVPAISVMSYDACLMGMAEVGYAFKDKVPYFTASEETEAGDGHDYTTLFNVLKSNPQNVTPAQLAAGYVTSFGNQYVSTSDNEDTYSAVKSANYAAFTTALKAFVDSTASASSTTLGYLRTARNAAIQYEGTDYKDFRDLGSFLSKVSANTKIPAAIRTAATNVISSLNTLVANKTADKRGSSGLAIYLPQSSYDSMYTTEFAAFNAATGWNTFAKWIATGSRSATSTAGVASANRGAASRGVHDLAPSAQAVTRSLLGYDAGEKATTIRVTGADGQADRRAERTDDRGTGLARRAAALIGAADEYLARPAATPTTPAVTTTPTFFAASVEADDVLAG